MAWRKILWLAAALLYSVGAQAAPASLFPAGTTDLAREAALAARDGKRLAVLFEQEGCNACLQLRRDVLSDKQLSTRFAARFRTVAINLASPGEMLTPDGKTVAIRTWAERVRILGTPALAFFDGKGQLLYRHVGSLGNGNELQLLGQYIARGEYEKHPFVTYLAIQQAKRQGTTASAICHTPKLADSR